MFHSDKVHLHLGLEKPVRILHLTDVHFSLADEIDGEDMQKHAALRRNIFFQEAGYPERDPVGYLEDAMEYSKGFDCTVITGDILDFTSHANQVMAKKVLAGKDYMFAAGNHEFCPKVGIPDSFQRKEEIFEDIQSNFRGNMHFESRLVGGVNVIAMDNSHYTWDEGQFALLKAEVRRGYPCLLFFHSPLTCPHMDHNPPHKDLHASEEVVALTREVNRYIAEEPAIKAVFSGHYHTSGTETLPGGKTGYILGGLFKGIVGEITID